MEYLRLIAEQIIKKGEIDMREVLKRFIVKFGFKQKEIAENVYQRNGEKGIKQNTLSSYFKKKSSLSTDYYQQIINFILSKK